MSTLNLCFHEEIIKNVGEFIAKYPLYSGYMSLVVRKPVFGVFDQVIHKPGCTTTQDG